ncbi:hypothetical protein PMZ80_008134 [Knufia obscura]|uniref:Prion-inhibition and propagation HeLo domain-containing protein n=2 Tax=Knufia TaxID=430999 RepID=A0AAN8IAT8_9EURO|nr:hypothetical protein PMZ80_008134 [Knufia obscura]KAK5957141.1 hypothetical protein OHC33_001510 [Knufia fluminis]
MDPASTAMGAIALYGLFSTILSSFEYIQYGRQFGEHYESAVLKLDVARLRLSRWAQSIGLNDDPKSQAKLESSLSKKEIDIAKNLLGNIAEAFENVERLSRKYEDTMRLIGDEEEGVLDVINGEREDDGLSARFKRMHLKAKSRIRSRQKSTSTANRARWALYEKKRFEDLIRDIRDHTDALIENFPRTVMVQGQLAAEEVKELTEDAQDRVMLKTIAQENDRILAQAVEKAIIVQDGHDFRDIRVSGYSRAFFGNDIAYGVKARGNTYSNMVIDGNAVVHAGNVYRARGQNQIEFGQETRRAATDLGTSTSLTRRW